MMDHERLLTGLLRGDGHQGINKAPTAQRGPLPHDDSERPQSKATPESKADQIRVLLRVIVPHLFVGSIFTGVLAAAYKLLWKTQQESGVKPLSTDGNYGIYHLNPSGVDLNDANLDIVFFHGLQMDEIGSQAWKRTWTTKDGVLWPGEWLPQEEGLKQARILSVCYSASLFQSAGKQDNVISTMAKQLLSQLTAPGVAVGGGTRKVFLVAHSLGGIVMNAVIVEASRIKSSDADADRFLTHLCGLVYYASPLRGAPIAGWKNLIPTRIIGVMMQLVMRKFVNDSLLTNLEVFSAQASKMRSDFLDTIKMTTIKPLCIAENKPMKLGLLGRKIIVPEASAHLDIAENHTVDADHIQIVKPSSPKDVTYTHLVRYIKERLKKKQVMKIAEINGTYGEPISRKKWIDKVNKLLTEHQAVIISAMGGAGKSTLSRMVYNAALKDEITYNQRVLHIWVGKTPDAPKQKAMQLELVEFFSRLAGQEVKSADNIITAALDKLINEVGEKSKSKSPRFMLILDDVWLPETLRSVLLLPADKLMECVMKTGSGLLITSRSGPDLCSAFHSTKPKLVENLLDLDMTEAKEIVKCYAFPEQCNNMNIISAHLGCSCEDLDNVLAELVNFCHNLPLHLRILGCRLTTKKINGWRDLMEDLKGKRDKILQVKPSPENVELAAVQNAVLSTSLEDDEHGMNANARRAFYVVALLFPSTVRAKGVLERWCKELFSNGALEALIGRSLLMLDEDMQQVRVHDALREYALEAISDNDYCKKNKLNFYFDDGHQKCHTHELGMASDVGIMNCTVDNMCTGRARILSLQQVKLGFVEQLKDFNLRELQFLGLDSVTGLQNLKAAMPQLKVLYMHDIGEGEDAGKLEILADWLKKAPQLRIIHFKRVVKLEELPKEITGCSELRDLILEECSSMLRLIPTESVGNLSKLENLELTGCSSLTGLPEDFGSLVALQKLRLSCDNLQSLPASFPALTALKELNLSWCTSLTVLPDDFGRLVALQKLNLIRCYKLQSLPSSFPALTALKELGLVQCTSLTVLPDDFGSLVALQKLSLQDCNKLRSLPASFPALTALKELDLSVCTSLTVLPDDFGRLVALQKLRIYNCKKLQSLPASFTALTALKELDLSGCTSLTVLPDDFGRLVALQKLDLSYCNKLRSLPASFKALTALKVERCSVLRGASAWHLILPSYIRHIQEFRE